MGHLELPRRRRRQHPSSQRRRTNERAPIPRFGACRVRPLFTGQNSQPSRRCEEGRHRATHGAAVGNRVSADAVGRRSSFLRARVVIPSDTSLRARRKDDAGAHEGRTRRPGLGISVRELGPRRDRWSRIAAAVAGANCGSLTRFADAAICCCLLPLKTAADLRWTLRYTLRLN